MLDGLHASAKLVGGFIGIYREPALQYAWPTIEFFGHKVHRAAVPFFIRIEHSLVRIQPRVGRQQGRMDVQDAAFVVLYKPGAEDAHESGQDNQLRFMRVENTRDGTVKGFPVRIIAMFEAFGSNARSIRSSQAMGIGLVAEDNTEVEINLALRRFVDE